MSLPLLWLFLVLHSFHIGNICKCRKETFLPFFYGSLYFQLVCWWAPEESDSGVSVEGILPLMLSCENQNISFLSWELVAALLTNCSRQMDRSSQPELWSDCLHQCFFSVPCEGISTLRVLQCLLLSYLAGSIAAALLFSSDSPARSNRDLS